MLRYAFILIACLYAQISLAKVEYYLVAENARFVEIPLKRAFIDAQNIALTRGDQVLHTDFSCQFNYVSRPLFTFTEISDTLYSEAIHFDSIGTSLAMSGRRFWYEFGQRFLEHYGYHGDWESQRDISMSEDHMLNLVTSIIAEQGGSIDPSELKKIRKYELVVQGKTDRDNQVNLNCQFDHSLSAREFMQVFNSLRKVHGLRIIEVI